MYVDSHCHLEQSTYADEVDQVINRAVSVGVHGLVVVGASEVTQGAVEALALAQRQPPAFAALGIHPHDAALSTPADFLLLGHLLTQPKVVALGEIGLDYFYHHSTESVEQDVFKTLLELSHTVNLPIMLHIRDAHADAITMLHDIGIPPKGGVVHCFTEGPEEAERYLRLGLYLSIPGILTFKNADKLREAVKMIPLDKMLIETDSPFLAPVPYRGKRNEPSFVVATAQAIAEIRGLTGPEIGATTSQNASRLFSVAEFAL